jgi:hypothetical protein
MENSEDGHLNADEQRGNSDLEIWVRNLRCCLHDIERGRGQNTDQEGLPKRQEDDKFDGCNFQEWSMRSEIEAELVVLLDLAVHSNRHCCTLNNQDLTTLAREAHGKEVYIPRYAQKRVSWKIHSIFQNTA